MEGSHISLTDSKLQLLACPNRSHALLPCIADVLGWDGLEVWHVGPEGLYRKAVWCTPRLAAYPQAPLSPALGLTGAPALAWQDHRPVWITDARREPTLFIRADVARQHGIQTVCAFPVSRRGQPPAVLVFLACARRVPSVQDIELCKTAASVLASAPGI